MYCTHTVYSISTVHAFSFYLDFYIYIFHSFSKAFFIETTLTFLTISKTKLLFYFFFLNIKFQYLNHLIKLYYKSLKRTHGKAGNENEKWKISSLSQLSLLTNSTNAYTDKTHRAAVSFHSHLVLLHSQ